MSHDDHAHAHGHGHHHHTRIADNLTAALLLNLAFSLVEIAGGLWTGSVAILADAVHDLGDATSLGLALALERMAARRSNQRFSYGYRRFSLLSALVTGAVLLVGSSLVLAQAVPRLLAPTTPKLDGMLVLAVLGVAVNGYAAMRLMRGATMNERVVSWHLVEDVLGWITVFVGTIVMMIWDMPIIDPILSIVFSLFIFLGVLRSVRGTLGLFLQATPENVDLAKLRGEIGRLPGVRGTHDAHLWSLDGESHVLTIHVVVDATATVAELEGIKGQVRALAAKRGKLHVTVETESEHVACPALECVREDGISSPAP